MRFESSRYGASSKIQNSLKLKFNPNPFLQPRHGFDGSAAAGRNGTEEDTVKQSERKAKRNSQLLAYEEKAKEIAASSLYGALEQDQDDEKARGVLFTQGE